MALPEGDLSALEGARASDPISASRLQETTKHKLKLAKLPSLDSFFWNCMLHKILRGEGEPPGYYDEPVAGPRVAGVG